MSDEARKQVEKILDNVGVKFNAAYKGVKRKALNGDSDMDEWDCTFTSGDSGRNFEAFEFFTGLGLRSPLAKPWGGGNMPRPGTLMREEMEKARKPKAPHAADVLYSLLMDGSALDQSFDEWCADFGYDTDSRKAERIFDACRDNARKLRRLFDQVAREALQTALQDY